MFKFRLLASSLTLFLFAPHAYAAPTSYDVHNNPDMFLDAGITGTATTGIFLTGPIRNGEVVSYGTLSGGILKFQQASREELVYYASGSVNALTKRVTLYGVIRDVCWNVARTIQTCGSGKIFSKGTSVRLVDAAQLLNLKANVDRANTFTAKNAIRFSGSGSLGQPTFATTAERDQQLGASPASGSGLLACVTGTGICYDGIGGTWVARAAGSTPNASDTVAGKVQLIPAGDIVNRTQTGSTAAMNVLTPRWLVKNGSGATSAFYLPQLGNNGAISASLGGTGLASPTQSGILVANGKNPMNLVSLGSSGTVVISNGSRWVSSTLRQKYTVVSPYQTADKAGTGASLTTERTLSGGTILPAGDCSTPGTTYHFVAPVITKLVSGNLTFKVKLNSTSLGTFTAYSSAGSRTFVFDLYIVCRSTGGSGTAYVYGSYGVGATVDYLNSQDTTPASTVTTIDWTAQQTVSLSATFSASDSGHLARFGHVLVTKITN